MSDEDIKDKELHANIGSKFAVYIKDKAWFGRLKDFSDKELFFEDHKGGLAVFPRGKYDIKLAREAGDDEK